MARRRRVAGQPRVLVTLQTANGWERGVLEGFHEVGLQHNWAILISHTAETPSALLQEWDPDVLLLGHRADAALLAEHERRVVVQVNPEEGASGRGPSVGVPWVVLDEGAAGELAAKHLLSRGLKHFAGFGYTNSGFSCARIARFREVVIAAGGVYVEGGEYDPTDAQRQAYSGTLLPWLHSLPLPCGVLGGCDSFARVLSDYCRRAGLRMPDDIALVGVDNDHLRCDLAAPPLSSVAFPWRQMGREAARLVALGLEGRPVPAEPVRIAPIGVVARRSSDVLAVTDPDVAAAVAWIRAHAHEPIMVPDILRAVPAFRRKLERRFRAMLGRSIMEEVRRAHVELAKRLLVLTRLSMPEAAARSGFCDATRLGIAFRRETGMTPSAYRRSFTAAVDPAAQEQERPAQDSRACAGEAAAEHLAQVRDPTDNP